MQWWFSGDLMGFSVNLWPWEICPYYIGLIYHCINVHGFIFGYGPVGFDRGSWDLMVV